MHLDYISVGFFQDFFKLYMYFWQVIFYIKKYAFWLLDIKNNTFEEKIYSQ